MLLQAAILLLCYSLKPCNGQTFSLFVANSSTLSTLNAVTAVDVALQLPIGENANVSRNQAYDSMCNVERAKSQLSNEVDSIALLDGSCSQVAEELSAPEANSTIKIIFSSTSAAINNNSIGAFRTVPSDRAIPPSLPPLFEYFDWQLMSLVTEPRPQYTELKRLIAQQFTSDQGDEEDEKTFMEFNSSDSDTISSLFADRAPHIFFLNTDIQTGIQFLCQGFVESHYYPNYLWIMPGWWYQVGVDTQWWEEPSLLDGTSCSEMTDLYTVLNRSLILRPIPAVTSNQDVQVFSPGNLTLADYSSSSYAFDATLSLLVALNKTGSPAGEVSSSELRSAFNDVQFYGASGFVSFDENGDRANTQLLVQQFITNAFGLSVTDVAIVENSSNITLLTSEESIFPDGVPPDGTPIKRNVTVHVGVTIAIAMLCFTGLVLAIICLLFNIVFKDKKIVKLTSPNLNYFLLAGVMILLSGMVFYIIGTTNIRFIKAICTLRRFLLIIGHDVGFTVALVKTWRIHHIFRNPSPNKRAPKDWQLFMAAFVIVSIDVLASIILLVPDNIYDDVDFVKDAELRPELNSQGVLVTYCAPSCGRTIYYLLFLVFTAVFKITLHVIAIILSFRIRNIVVDTLNDFKFTSIIIYTSTILILILVIVLVLLVEYINVYATLVPFLVFLEVLVFLLFSFVPKMIALYKDPQGHHVFDKPKRQHEPSSLGGSLKRNVSLTQYNRKDSAMKDDDSGRCTLDSKEQKEQIKDKQEDEVFLENGTNGVPPSVAVRIVENGNDSEGIDVQTRNNGSVVTHVTGARETDV